MSRSARSSWPGYSETGRTFWSAPASDSTWVTACRFSRTYDTPDGTCIRDYIHILDLARAHQVAATGVDFLAVGALTHSAPVLDLGFDLRD